MAAQRRPWKVPVGVHAHRVLALDPPHDVELAVEPGGGVLVGEFEGHTTAVGVHGGVDGAHASAAQATQEGVVGDAPGIARAQRGDAFGEAFGQVCVSTGVHGRSLCSGLGSPPGQGG